MKDGEEEGPHTHATRMQLAKHKQLIHHSHETSFIFLYICFSKEKAFALILFSLGGYRAVILHRRLFLGLFLPILLLSLLLFLSTRALRLLLLCCCWCGRCFHHWRLVRIRHCDICFRTLISLLFSNPSFPLLLLHLLSSSLSLLPSSFSSSHIWIDGCYSLPPLTSGNAAISRPRLPMAATNLPTSAALSVLYFRVVPEIGS